MIPADIVSSTFKRPLTPPQAVKDKQHCQIEDDVERFLNSGGKITHISQGVGHLMQDDFQDFELTTVQEIDI
jgi:hypothetical protein